MRGVDCLHLLDPGMLYVSISGVSRVGMERQTWGEGGGSCWEVLGGFGCFEFPD